MLGDLLDGRLGDRLQDLDLLVADLFGGEADGRLHGHVAEQLEHVVLDQVAQRAGRVVVVGAGADAEVLGGGDLDAVDEVPVPQRLEHAVGETEGHHVLDGLLAQVVVDPVDLALLEARQHLAVQLAGLLEGRAEGLLDDQPHFGVRVVGELGLAELLDDHGEEVGRRREVEGPVERARRPPSRTPRGRL